jgi:uncharacterized protein (DUF488 family)
LLLARSSSAKSLHELLAVAWTTFLSEIRSDLQIRVQNMSGDGKAILYTIGYEQRSVELLISELQKAGVRRLVDVRMNPVSRKKGFSKRLLAEALMRSGIDYEHVPQLGSPKEVRSIWTEDLAEGKRRFRKHIEGADQHIDYLVGLARLKPVAILCLERDSARCHRSIISDLVAERAPDIEIIHL